MDRPLTYQDLREGSPTFGAVAVQLPDGSSLGVYGVMTTDRGGSFPRSIEGWTPLEPVTPPAL